MNKLNVKIVGKGGAPLVLLHGWGWHSGIWEPLLPELEKNHQLFLVDLPGFGKSPLLSNDYSLENVCAAIMEAIPDKAAWLGWSLGGLFATWAAIHFPERVSRLITVASSPCFVSASNWPGVEISTLEKFSVLLKSDHKKTLLDFLELQLRGTPKRNELFTQLQKKLFVENEDFLFALQSGLKLLRDTDLRSDLKNISCESLHIFGTLDTIVPAGIANSLISFLPQAQNRIIKHTGHMPFLTHQDVFIELI